MSAVVPLDPDSPRGRALAEELTQVFAEVRLAIARRQLSKPPKQGTPTPSRPPRQPTRPAAPKPPKKGAA